MSFMPNFNAIQTGISRPIYDDIQYYANLTELNALTQKFNNVTYVTQDNGNRYTWNGTTFNLLIEGGGAIHSVVSGNGTIIATNVANNITISTTQELRITDNPTFNRITSTLNPSAPQHVATKNYVDTNTVQSITSSNTNLLTITGTSADPIINPLIGAGEALLYNFSTGVNPGVNELTVNNSGDFSTSTIIKIRYTALNRSDNEYIKTYLRLLTDNIPFEIALLQDNNGANYVSFIATALINVGPNYIEFTIQKDPIAGNSTVNTFANGTVIKMFICDITRTITAGTGITVTNPNPRSVVISGGAPSTTENRNILKYVDIQSIGFPNDLPLHQTLYDEATGNLLFYPRLDPATMQWGEMIAFQGSAHPQKLIRNISGAGGRQYTTFGIKLTGGIYSAGGPDLNFVAIGFASREFLSLSQNNITSSTSIIYPTYDVSATSNNRAFFCVFAGSGANGALLFANGGTAVGTRIGFTGDSITTAGTGDILTITFNSLYQPVIKWFLPDGTLRSTAFFSLPAPAPAILRDNFFTGSITPIVSTYFQGTGLEYTVLSERYMQSLGILDVDNIGYFY